MKKALQPLIITAALTACSSSSGSSDAPEMFAESVEHFALADANSDGGLDLSEFRDFVELEAEDDIGRSRRIKRFNAYERAFNTLDADADGAVTPDEIGASQAQLK